MKKYFIIFIIMLCPLFVNAESEIIDVTLDKCVDGDTANFKLESGDVIPVRFLAIDAPETNHSTKGEEFFGNESSEFTCKALENADNISLEYDENSDKEDSYGRSLAWVFVDNVLLQSLIVKDGYAKVAYLYGDYKYTESLKEQEKDAKNSKLGIWQDVDIEEDTEEVVEVKTERKEEKGILGFFKKIIDGIVNFLSSIVTAIVNFIDNFLNSSANK